MQNGTMLQYFHWYYPQGGSLWEKLESGIHCCHKAAHQACLQVYVDIVVNTSQAPVNSNEFV